MLDSLSFSETRIDNNGDRTVVDKFHLHVGTEDALGSGFAGGRRNFFAKELIKRYGNVMTCGVNIARTIPFL